MRMKMIQAIKTVARWVQRVLEVQMPMAALHGLRTRVRQTPEPPGRGGRSGLTTSWYASWPELAGGLIPHVELSGPHPGTE